jgi:hypothetical protein
VSGDPHTSSRRDQQQRNNPGLCELVVTLDDLEKCLMVARDICLDHFGFCSLFCNNFYVAPAHTELTLKIVTEAKENEPKLS